MSDPSSRDYYIELQWEQHFLPSTSDEREVKRRIHEAIFAEMDRALRELTMARQMVERDHWAASTTPAEERCSLTDSQNTTARRLIAEALGA